MGGGVITTGSNPKLLWPGLQEVFGIAYKEHPLTYPSLFSEVKSDKNYEEYVGYVGLGLAQFKGQGQPIAFDSMQQGFTTRLTNATYALGYACTEEEIDDNLYDKISKGRTRALAFSMRQAHELNAHLVYNRAFTAERIGADSVCLCSTAHLSPSGLTYANRPTTAADLSEVSLEDALVAIKGFTDDKGLLINVTARKLVVARQDWYNALRLTKSVYQPGTANNDVNATKWDNALPEGCMQSVYLTNPHFWYILTDAGGEGHGLIHQTRKAVSFFNDNDFTTRNMMAAASERYACGWDNPRAIWGNPGP